MELRKSLQGLIISRSAVGFSIVYQMDISFSKTTNPPPSLSFCYMVPTTNLVETILLT